MLLFILFFIVLPILGIMAIQAGNWDWAIFCFFPIIALAIYGIVWFTMKLSDRRWAAVCRLYELPKRDVRPEYVGGELMHIGFRTVIDYAIKKATDPDKLHDLQHCRRTVLNTLDDHYVDTELGNIRRAFRYTGCHIRIEDPDGNTIANII